MSLTLRDGPGSAPPKPPWCRGINENSATRHPSCEPKPGTGQRASGILSRVIDPTAGDMTPSPARGGIGMEAPYSGGGRIKRTRPSPVPPLCPAPCSCSPTATASAFTGFLCSETPRHAFAGHRAPGGAGVPGRAVPTAGGRARSRSPRPAGDSRAAVLCRAVPGRVASRPVLSSPVLQRTISSFSTKNSYKCTATVQQLQPRRAEPCPAAPRRAELFRVVPRERNRGRLPCRARPARAAVSAGSVVPLPLAVPSRGLLALRRRGGPGRGRGLGCFRAWPVRVSAAATERQGSAGLV